MKRQFIKLTVKTSGLDILIPVDSIVKISEPAHDNGAHVYRENSEMLHTRENIENIIELLK